jgi:hypothetical protein
MVSQKRFICRDKNSARMLPFFTEAFVPLCAGNAFLNKTVENFSLGKRA